MGEGRMYCNGKKHLEIAEERTWAWAWEWNGMEWNGMEWHGMAWHGMAWHGMEWNGMEWNGMEWNGMEWNGMEWNGMEWNGMEENKNKESNQKTADRVEGMDWTPNELGKQLGKAGCRETCRGNRGGTQPRTRKREKTTTEMGGPWDEGHETIGHGGRRREYRLLTGRHRRSRRTSGSTSRVLLRRPGTPSL